MNFTIAIQDEIFQVGSSHVVSSTSELKGEPITLPNIDGQSEIVTEYVDCFQGIQKIVADYKELLNGDMNRIKSIITKMQVQEEALLQSKELPSFMTTETSIQSNTNNASVWGK